VNSSKPSAQATLIGLILSFAVFLTIELYWIDRPFGLRHEDCATTYSGAALNHLRLGPKVTKLHDLLEPNTGWYGDTSIRRPYLHHPPGVSLTLAGTFALFGFSTAAARATPLLFHWMAAMAVFFIVHRCLKSAWLASLGSLVYLLMPLTAYYGRLVNQEPFAVGCMATSLLFWLQNLEHPSHRSFVASVAAGGLGCLYAWPCFFFMGCMTVEGVLRRDSRALAYVLTALVLGLLLISHIAYIAGSTGELLQILRMQLTERWDKFESWGQILHRVAVETRKNFTLPVIGAIALWLLHRAVRRFRRRSTLNAQPWLARAAMIMFVTGALHLLVFRYGALSHEFWTFYLAIPAAMLVPDLVQQLVRTQRLQRVVVVAFALAVAYAASPEAVARFEGNIAPFTWFLRIHPP
jgi:4-amino-4-deoxy-L-arabinose transferase-like glycosyltransferase